MGSAPSGQGKLTAGETRKRTIHVTCECGHAFAAEVYASINAADDPDVAEDLAEGALQRTPCPRCDTLTTVSLPLVYHDPRLPLFVVLLPETMRHAEIGTRIDVLRQLAAESVDLPQYVRRVEVVFGIDGLQRRCDAHGAVSHMGDGAFDADDLRLQAALIEQRETDLDRREEDLLSREEDLASKQEDLLSRRSALERTREELSTARVEIEREREALRALSLDLAGQKRSLLRAKQQLPDGMEPVKHGEPPDSNKTAITPLKLEGRPREETDRWRTGDTPTARFLHHGTVFLAARPGANLGQYRAAAPALRLQIHHHKRIAVPVLVALPDEGHREGCRPLRWTLNPGATGDRQILDHLAETFSVTLDLFDDESRPVATWKLDAPLAANAELVRERTADFTPSLAEFEEISRSVAELEIQELLGRKQHNFTEDSFVDLPSPSAARLALGIIGYWSEADNEDYLLFTKSFPVEHWCRIRERVVDRSLEFGLRLGPPLIAFSLSREKAHTEAELLRKAVSNFAEVSLGLKTNDLDPIQEWGNWKTLLADCVRHNVQVEQQIEALAAGAARRAQEWGAAMVDETEPGGDLGTLSEAQLLPLLTDHAQRRDAAVELCERGKTDTANSVFAAVRNMTRGEVVRVIPAMVQFGEAATPLFVQGLRHHKSFIRQGCALGLGALRAVAAIEPLVEMMLAEPTRIWMEAARAHGEFGVVVLQHLQAMVAGADGEGRERIAWAMGAVALSPDGRNEVERLSRDSNALLAKVARRALHLLDQVSRIDAEVRGAGPTREQTIVRAFSRRFYESMAGDVNELTEDDIVEQEEVLGDADILEAMEVSHNGPGAER